MHRYEDLKVLFELNPHLNLPSEENNDVSCLEDLKKHHEWYVSGAFKEGMEVSEYPFLLCFLQQYVAAYPSVRLLLPARAKMFFPRYDSCVPLLLGYMGSVSQ